MSAIVVNRYVDTCIYVLNLLKIVISFFLCLFVFAFFGVGRVGVMVSTTSSRLSDSKCLQLSAPLIGNCLHLVNTDT